MFTPHLAATTPSSWILESLIYSFSYNIVIGVIVLLVSFAVAYGVFVMGWGKLWNKKWKPAKVASQNLFFLVLSLILSLCMVSLTAYWDASGHETKAFTTASPKAESSAKPSGWGNTTQTKDSNKGESKYNNNTSSADVESMIDTMRNKAEGDITKSGYDSGRSWVVGIFGGVFFVLLSVVCLLSIRGINIYPFKNNH